MDKKEFRVEREHQGRRLDVFILERMSLPSRAFVQKIIRKGLVVVNDKSVEKLGFLLREGDRISVCVPDPEPLDVLPEDIPITVLYEDADLLVIDKPKGMVVHPAAGNRSGTLVNALLARCPDLSGIGGVERPGIIHRLDKDTSGVLVVAKSDRAHLGLAAQIKEHRVKRIYYGIIYGRLNPDEGTIATQIGRHPQDRKKMAVLKKGGKQAITHYRTLEVFPAHSLVEFRLETGRTHQIRVHTAYKNHPLVGDVVYAGKRDNYGLTGQALHAAVLGFFHPVNGMYMEFTSPMPEEMQKMLLSLKKGRENP